MKFKGIIYKVTNLCNNECYIGKTSQSLNNRISRHKRDAIRNNKKNIYFYNAIRKYGWDNFKLEVLKDNITDPLMLNLMETFMIMVHHTHYTEGGYNLTWGGDGFSVGNKIGLGRKHTKEWKEHMSKRFSGENHPLYGKKHTKEAKERMSKSHIGLIKSDETKERMSKSHIGLIKTEKHRLNLSLSLKDKSKSIEHCKKISEAKKGSIPWNKGMKFKNEA